MSDSHHHPSRRPCANRPGTQCAWLTAGALWVVLLLAWWPAPATAQPPTAQETSLKAAYLVKFTQYTTWPTNTFASDNVPVVIGVVGAESLFSQLEREAKGFTGSRPVEARRVATVEEAARCHVLFVGEEEGPKEEAWLGALKGNPILTVGESERTIELGAVMRFVIKAQHVRFEANLAAAAQNHLALNERMLAVAARVHRRPSGE